MLNRGLFRCSIEDYLGAQSRIIYQHSTEKVLMFESALVRDSSSAGERASTRDDKPGRASKTESGRNGRRGEGRNGRDGGGGGGGSGTESAGFGTHRRAERYEVQTLEHKVVEARCGVGMHLMRSLITPPACNLIRCMPNLIRSWQGMYPAPHAERGEQRVVPSRAAPVGREPGFQGSGLMGFQGSRCISGFRVDGLGSWVYGLWFRLQGSVCHPSRPRTCFGVKGSGCRVQGLGCRVEGVRLRV